jgi:predicted alpha-1,6-mannanase (GH76 family)
MRRALVVPVMHFILLLAAVGPVLPSPALPYRAEAARQLKSTVSHFYNRSAKIWQPLVEDAESIGRQGYTFWPSVLALQAVVDAAKVDPATWQSQIGTYFDVLEQYYHPLRHGYCAWIYFKGNMDLYYDDNAWALITFVEAFEITNDRRFFARAIDVMSNFELGGWNNTAPYGMRWGTMPGQDNRQDRDACTNGAGALAAFKLAAHTKDAGPLNTTFLVNWGKRALDWVRDELSSPEGLIYDGLSYPHFQVSQTRWTYNTGVAIQAALRYRALHIADTPSIGTSTHSPPPNRAAHFPPPNRADTPKLPGTKATSDGQS